VYEHGIIVLEWDQRPSETKEAWICVGVSDQLSPNHNQNESCHNTRGWHGRSFGFALCFRVKLGCRTWAKLWKYWPFLVHSISDGSVPKAKLVVTKIVVIWPPTWKTKHPQSKHGKMTSPKQNITIIGSRKDQIADTLED